MKRLATEEKLLEAETDFADSDSDWMTRLPYTSPYGEKYRMVASVKSDLYYVDNYTNEDDQNFTGGVARVFPQVPCKVPSRRRARCGSIPDVFGEGTV